MPQSSSVAATTPGSAAKAASPWTVTPGLLERPDDAGHEVGRDRLVDEQRLGGVADRGALGLGVEHDRQRPVEVGRGVDVDVAVADAGLDHRHGRPLDDRADQPGAAARHQDVDQPARPHQRDDRLAAVGGDQLHHVGGEPGGRRRVAQHRDHGPVGRSSARRAAQQHRVAGLQADPGGVGRDVGTAPRRPSRPRRTAPGPGAAPARWPGCCRAPPRPPGRAARPRRAAPAPSRPPAPASAAAGRRRCPASRRRSARARSSALAASTSSQRPTRPSAMATRAASLAARVSSASARAATRARDARSRTRSSDERSTTPRLVAPEILSRKVRLRQATDR